MRLSLIRFLGAARFHTARWPDDSDHPRHPSPPALRHDAYVAIRSCRTGWASGSESLAPVLPWCGDDARRRLRCTRSHGRHWFPGFPASPPPARTSFQAGGARRCSRVRLHGRPCCHRYYAPLRLPNAHPEVLRVPACPAVPVVPAFCERDRPGGAAGLSCGSFGHAVDSPRSVQLRLAPRFLRQEADEALTSSRVIPVSTCSGLRPRWPPPCLACSDRADTAFQRAETVRTSHARGSGILGGGYPLRDHDLQTTFEARYRPC